MTPSTHTYTHTPSSEREQAIQRLAGGVDSWPPVWPHHTRSQTHTHCYCIRCIRLLDGALLWPGWACKVQFWLPCPGLLGQGCDLESTPEPHWRGKAEQSVHIVLDRALGAHGVDSLTRQLLISPMCSHTSHNCSAHKHLHTQCESLPHILRSFS